VHRAYAFWAAHDFQCTNWWYNEIGMPKVIGTASLLLGGELVPAEFAYATGTSLSRYPIGRTGQNRVWLAGNTLMLGLLKGDPSIIAAASDAIWGEVRVTTGEGIQPDFSFHQHGPQQQFGNYGLAFAVETARWGRILRDTPWQLPGERLSTFRRYLLDGQNWVSWRGAMDISACGRQLMPHSPREKAAAIALVMEQAASFDPSQALAYRAFVARNDPRAENDLVGNRYFWRSDYMVHRRPGFAATLKLSSRRVIGAELVNSEDLSGFHLGDGALYLYRDGGEYQDIFPVWDWRMLPGVTCTLVEPPSFKTSSVDSDFVGGVSDGADCCCALDYRRESVRAKKAWFLSGDTVVCLGAGISGTAPAAIATTLNQCLLRGPVQVFSGRDTRSLGPGSHSLRGAKTVEHDGWRYSLLDDGSLNLETGPVTGNWHRVFDNPDSPKEDVTKEVFKLWLDHGRSPVSAHYAFEVTPVASTEKAIVIENSAICQAVLLPGANVGIVFWSAGEVLLPDGRRIAADEPCLVLAGAKGALVVDPTQKLRRLNVRIDGADHAVELPAGGLTGTGVAISAGS
jgi:chondroitin AC lyase